MKKSLILILGLITFTLIWTNCSKSNEDIQADKQKNTFASSRENPIDPFNTTKVRLSQGMLEFDNYRTYKEIYQNLRTISKNPQAEQNAYQELGYVMDLESQSNITDQPILEKFENQFNYLSARKVEENQFFNFLSQGGNPSNFQGSFLFNDFLKSLLNQNNEVKIGSRIFKFLDEKNVAIILNSDFDALQTVRNTPINQLKDFYNVLIWNKYDPEDASLDLFEKDTNGSPLEFSVLCGGVAFSIKSVSGSTFTFENTTQSESLCGFTWDFGDGTPVFNGTNPPPHTYAAGKLPATVKLSAKGKQCGCDKMAFSLGVNENSGNIPPCNADFTIEVKNGNVVDVTGLSSAPNTTFSWNFGDGGSGNGKTSQHVYSATGVNTFTITLTVTGLSGTCNKTKTVSAGCGFRNAKKSKQEDKDISGRKWRLAANIWCDNSILGTEVGSSSKCFRRWGGIWWQKKADKLWVSIEGFYYEQSTTKVGDETITQCGAVNIPYLQESEDNSNYVARNIDANDPSFLDNVLKSTHKIKVGSTEWEISELFLVN